MNGRGYGMTDAQRNRRAEILRAVQAEPHRTLESFGQQFGVTRERIRQIVTGTLGVPKPPAGTFTKPVRLARIAAEKERARQARRLKREKQAREVIALHHAGMTWEEIAAALGVCFHTVARRFRYARAHNIPGIGPADHGRYDRSRYRKTA